MVNKSYKNEDYTVRNQGLDSVTKEIKHNNPSHRIKLYEIDYLYVICINWLT